MKKYLILNKIIFLILIGFFFLYANCQIEQWGQFEIVLKGPKTVNPFKDVSIKADFFNADTKKTVTGFYDGSGKYIIRFMPEIQGNWTYKTSSNISELNNQVGAFECIKPSVKNHGLVKVDKQFHFCYSDGTPYYPFGTTVYALTHQPDTLQERTLETLAYSSFNKIRMCVFPLDYDWTRNEPEIYPFEGDVENGLDFNRFNPEFFQKLEKRILQLQNLNIECDLILFHPYDKGRWGFDKMEDEQDDFYLRYVIARLASFRNIWWSMANEFDFVKAKDDSDWDRMLQIVKDEDPYKHLSSIHNGKRWYNYSKDLVTHASLQKQAFDIKEWREKFQKPIIVDECKYEGNIKYRWGDLTAEAMTQQFWEAITRGGYASHGETYMHAKDIIWWTKGGVLHGGSPKRIAFLRDIVEALPENGLTPFQGYPLKWNQKNAVKLNEDFFLYYFSERQPIEQEIVLPENGKFELEIIDTWEMTINKIEGLFSGCTLIHLPGKPYMALRAKRSQ